MHISKFQKNFWRSGVIPADPVKSITVKQQLPQSLYGSLDFVWHNSVEPVPEEIFIHSHLSWSSIIPYVLPPSFMIHGILVQFTCLAVFLHNFRPRFLGLAPSTSYSVDFFTQSFVFFSQHMPVPSQPIFL